jgi:hypothetical protein
VPAGLGVLSGRDSVGGQFPGLKTWAKLCTRFAAGRFAPRNAQTPDQG